jgi:methionyl aminopeptidase
VTEILDELHQHVRPGVTTGELDAVAVRALAQRGARSNFKGYAPHPRLRPYPGVICASVNDEIVHGIPGKRVLKAGDIVSIDLGAIVEGWHGDSAITLPVGAVSDEAARLLAVTQEALQRGVAQAQPGNRVGDISRAVQQYVESESCSVVREYVGHGIGRALHEEPSVPNYRDPRQPGPRLRPGMVICIEPMVSAGVAETRALPDGWTVVTADGSLAAHFEHMVAITEGGPEVLTAIPS